MLEGVGGPALLRNREVVGPVAPVLNANHATNATNLGDRNLSRGAAQSPTSNIEHHLHRVPGVVRLLGHHITRYRRYPDLSVSRH